MNRSILIVICDFLLVSLLLFSTPDISRVNEETAQRPVKMEPATNQVDSGNDLAAVMRLALDEERKNRDRLLAELASSRKAAEQRQAMLTERERQLQSFQQQLQTREELTARLQREQSELERQQASLEQQFASAQTNLQVLNQQLESRRAEASQSQEKLTAVEAELRKRAEEAAAMEQRITQLAKSNQMVLGEKQRLSTQLQVAEVEKRHAADQVVALNQQVKVEREEKARLAEGVKVLANKSGELAQEIRVSRPLVPNAIFNEFVTNRVHAQFTAFRPGLFGNTKERDTETVLVTNGTNAFALCHVDDTPLTLTSPGTDWEEFTGTLGRNSASFPIRLLSFHLQDPRVVLIPLTQTEVRQLGCKLYPVSSDPFKFQDAVLVGASEGYYGECKFEIDLSTPNYVKLDRGFLRGLVGKFNPSRGDLVFSKTGELLGVMVNGTYCLMIHSFEASATFQLGKDMRVQRTGSTLSALYSLLAGMPFKLQ